MTVRPPPGQRLPEVVWVAHQVVIEEAEALRSALEDFSNPPQPGCPFELDRTAWSDTASPQAEARRRIFGLAVHQAVLIYINAYDHMLTLGKALVSDGATTLFAHASLSRVVCEAAVRFAWILDPDAGCEERIMRGAAALLVSADQRLKGVNSIPARQFNVDLRQAMINNCVGERDSARALIERAGVRLAWSKDRKQVARLELDTPQVAVPVKLDVTQLMTDLLPDSPGWYIPASSITHSLYWGLRDAISSAPGEPLALTPSLAEVGAAAETAISASGLILSRCGAYYGHDAQAQLQQTKTRREAIDLRMRRLAAQERPREPEGGNPSV